MNRISDNYYTLEVVKACVDSVMFVAMCVFTYVIKVTEHDSLHLDHEVHYRLLLQQSICLMGFNAAGSAIHGIRSLRLPTTRLTCWILFDLQVVMGRGITLTLMCMCACLSVCRPLHYRTLVRSLYRWMMLAAWFLALINPLVFTVVAFAQNPWSYLLSPDSQCPTALEDKGFTISVLLFLDIMTLFMFLSYILICLEGHYTGHFSESNTKGRLTILVHVLQISLYFVTVYIIISHVQQELIVEIVTFLIFSILQVLSPVIYGLRCKELNMEILRLFPGCCSQCVTQESSVSVEQRESPGTLRRPSVVVISTGTSHCMSSVTDHVSAHESDNKNKDQIREDYEETLV
ncbi:olfactory receptor 4N2-like [Hemibagrus wyckioides]|nr:olfactory receptor 4N2-like [Hemibagrus wyckioides]